MLPVNFLGQVVHIEIDRPVGSRHPEHGYPYPINYGFVRDYESGDGEDLDAYVLGINYPLSVFEGRCIAVIHRLSESDDKLVLAPEGATFSDEEIRRSTYFQEQFFQSEIVRS